MLAFLLLSFIPYCKRSTLISVTCFDHAIFLTILINVLLVLIWIGLGKVVGILVSVISFSFICLSFAKLQIEYKLYFAVPFFITSLIGFLMSKKFFNLEQKFIITKQKIEEDINLLNNDIEEGEKDILLLNSRLQRYRNLSGVIERLSSTLEEDELTALIADIVFKVSKKSDRCLMFKVDTEKQELELVSSVKKTGVLSSINKKGDVFDRWVFWKKQPLLVSKAKNDFRFLVTDEDMHGTLSSIISVPIMSKEKVLGMLRLDSCRDDNYTQEDLRLLDIMGEIFSVYFVNAMLYKRLEELAITDGLTGLFVNKYFKERLLFEVKRSRKTNDLFSLAIMDIDNFKSYNDKYGHMAGDIVIKHIAKILKETVEGTDIVSRYGGEEFAILFPGRKKEETIKILEAIRKKLSTSPIVLRRQDTHITVSIGLAVFPEDADGSDKLFRNADRMLYKAKETGKNKICSL